MTDNHINLYPWSVCNTLELRHIKSQQPNTQITVLTIKSTLSPNGKGRRYPVYHIKITVHHKFPNNINIQILYLIQFRKWRRVFPHIWVKLGNRMLSVKIWELHRLQCPTMIGQSIWLQEPAQSSIGNLSPYKGFSISLLQRSLMNP